MTHTGRWKTIALDEVDSTNNYLRNLQVEDSVPITLVTAEFQTSGRGQRGNSWESERGMNLVFSLLVHPQLPVGHIFSLSEACALAIRDALSAFTEGVEVKWPNDIYWHEKKIAGILIETTLTGKRIEDGIIGVGVNINQQEFFSDAPNPVSLRQITGEEHDREAVLGQIMDQFVANMSTLLAGNFEALHHRYMEVLYRRDGLHPYYDEQGHFWAEIASVEPTGHLILRDTEGHERRYAFKEVQFMTAPTPERE